MRPTFISHFANTKRLNPLIDFSRLDTAAGQRTYWDSDGLLKYAPIGAPAFDHDPVTGESLGLGVWESSINLLLNSETLSTQSVTTAATTYTLSYYGTGSIALSGTYTGTLASAGASPVRSILTFTATAGTLTLTVTGTCKYANLEAKVTPTPWIPTAGSAVTRAAENASVSGSKFSSWYRQDEGTFLVGWHIPDTTSASDSVHQIFRVTKTGTAEQIAARMGYSGTRKIRALAQDVSSVFQYAVDSTTNTNTGGAFAFGFNTLNNFNMSSDGASVLSDTSGNMSGTAINVLQLGSNGANYLNGSLKFFYFIPKLLTNTQLQELSK
jgi:hypothetical protein